MTLDVSLGSINFYDAVVLDEMNHPDVLAILCMMFLMFIESSLFSRDLASLYCFFHVASLSSSFTQTDCHK